MIVSRTKLPSDGRGRQHCGAALPHAASRRKKEISSSCGGSDCVGRFIRHVRHVRAGFIEFRDVTNTEHRVPSAAVGYQPVLVCSNLLKSAPFRGILERGVQPVALDTGESKPRVWVTLVRAPHRKRQQSLRDAICIVKRASQLGWGEETVSA